MIRDIKRPLSLDADPLTFLQSHTRRGRRVSGGKKNFPPSQVRRGWIISFQVSIWFPVFPYSRGWELGNLALDHFVRKLTLAYS